MTRAIRALSIFLLSGASAIAAPARAHQGSTKYVGAERTERGARLDVAVDAVDASLTAGLGLEPADDALLARGDVIAAWLARDLRVDAGGTPCAPAAGPARVVARDGRRFVELPIDFDCGGAAGSLRLRDDSVFADDPDHRAFVSLRHGEGTEAHVLRDGAREVVLDAGGRASIASTAWAFFADGVVHLASGLDHLLFLVSLLLGALLASRREPRRALRELAVVVTAFTFGHSASLVASTLGWIALPSAPVELAIAASIAVVAVLNVARPDARAAHPMLATAFGVVHGFGLASVLVDADLSAAHRAVGLLSFNAGVEIAQLAFVAALFAAATAVEAKEESARRAVRLGSIAIAAIAAVWIVERAAEV